MPRKTWGSVAILQLAATHMLTEHQLPTKLGVVMSGHSLFDRAPTPRKFGVVLPENHHTQGFAVTGETNVDLNRDPAMPRAHACAVI